MEDDDDAPSPSLSPSSLSPSSLSPSSLSPSSLSPSTLASLRNEFVAYWRLTLAEIATNRVGYALGFMACLVVVVVVGLASAVLSRFPLMFAKFAELDNGQIDVSLTPKSSAASPYLDFVQYADLVANRRPIAQTADGSAHLLPSAAPALSLASPRISLRGALVAPSSRCLVPQDAYSLTNYSWVYLGAPPAPNCRRESQKGTHCFDVLCPERVGAFVSVIDSAREYAMDLGRAVGQAAPLGRHECQVSDEFALANALKVGDDVFVLLNLRTSFPSLWPTLVANASQAAVQGDAAVPVSPSPNATVDLLGAQHPLVDRAVLQLRISRVYAVEDNPKYDKDDTPALLLEYGTLFQELSAYLHPAASSSLRNALNETDPYRFARQILVNFPPPRLQVYEDPDIDAMHREMLRFVAPLTGLVRYDEVAVGTPIFRQINNTLRWMSLFLGLIMNLIIFVLLLLSVILIYSLLMTSVESRTFQVGILRMVGMRRRQLVQFLVFQALSFSVPSILVGVPLSQLLSWMVSYLFLVIADLRMDVSLTVEALSSAVALGVLVPVLSSLIPIRRALAHNLHQAVDVRRNQLAATEVVLERSDDHRVSPSLLVVSSLLLLFGFAIYYLFPLALISTNVSLLLNIFFFLLLLMLFGLVMLLINFQALLEKLLVFLFFFWETPTVPHLLRKNLMAHRRRNKLTTLLYAISLAFIVFLLVSYDVQIQSLLIARNQRHATALNVFSTGHFSHQEMEALHGVAASFPALVSGVSFISQPLDYQVDGLSYQGMSNLGRIYKYPTSVRTCTPDFFSTAMHGFLVPSEYDATSIGGDLLAQLYRSSERVLAIVGSTFSTVLSLGRGASFLLQLETADEKRLLVSEVSAMLDSSPFFSFSQYPIMASRLDLLVSIPAFAKIAGLDSVDDVRFNTMLVKLRHQDDITGKQLAELGSNFTSVSPNLYTWDFHSGLKSLETADTVVSLFFGVAIVIAMLISCFSLTSSMMTNIWEQAKEIGVLRAIGLPSFWSMRIYIYESFLVVLSSSLIGIVIGTFIGWTMSLQRAIFTNLPTPFSFPTGPLIITFIASLFFAVIASYSPIKALLRNSIIHNMRLLS